MNLKDLLGVQPDPTMTQTILNFAQASGVDVYASIEGVAKTITSGENAFFDQVYNLEWFIGALQVAGFNFLAQSSTKIPQTESGMDGLKGAYRNIVERTLQHVQVLRRTDRHQLAIRQRQAKRRGCHDVCGLLGELFDVLVHFAPTLAVREPFAQNENRHENRRKRHVHD